MKRNFIILIMIYTLLALFLSTKGYAQNKFERIAFMFTQDVKLAVMEDDHGNKPFTPDVRITMLWKGIPTNYGNLEVRTGFEYADLSVTKYIRYSGGVGYSFNWMPIPGIEYKYTIAPFINYGIIVRGSNQATLGAFEFGFDLKFPIYKGWKVVSTMQWTDRNDINKRFDTFDAVRDNFNWGVGLEVIVL